MLPLMHRYLPAIVQGSSFMVPLLILSPDHRQYEISLLTRAEARGRCSIRLCKIVRDAMAKFHLKLHLLICWGAVWVQEKWSGIETVRTTYES